ncbi:uncharacterized protein LOC116348678 [Contarinia nasturtii]|uniref:uncharacterized protein LOC116348678 n=1 Tax=Contarinia nasturtii TaxID=265458 RepID=UPI0012D3982F|nr:uncharacterized protein LOC116348678 [Contarinia nasturtii]
MKYLLYFALLLLVIRLNFAFPVGMYDEYNEFEDNYDYDDDPWYTYDLPKSDTPDVHSIHKKDNINKPIFNPRKRRDRRKQLRASYTELHTLQYCWNQHDSCDSIGAQDTKYGLTNSENRRFWHCNCDMEFYHCLHRVNSTLSNNIGEMNFNYNYRCYRFDMKIKKCNEYATNPHTLQERCIQYQLNLNSPRKTQWFDLPFYSGKTLKHPLFVVG